MFYNTCASCTASHYYQKQNRYGHNLILTRSSHRRSYFSSPRMCLNLRALIFHRNNKKEGRRSAYRQTCFWVSQSHSRVSQSTHLYDICPRSLSLYTTFMSIKKCHYTNILAQQRHWAEIFKFTQIYHSLQP